MLTTVLKLHNKVDIVLIDTYSTINFYYAFLISQLCRILNKDYIPILHGGNLPMRLKSSPFMCRLLFTKAKLNVSPSMYLISQFERAGYKNLKCIPNAVNVENYPFKERDNKTIKILWVRSLARIYNPELALQVLTNLKMEGLDVSLTMVGPDREGVLNSLKSMVLREELDVTFTGKLSMAEWTKLSESHHIFLNTSNFDNMPVSIIEAMLLGLPVVSTNVGGCKSAFQLSLTSHQ